MWGHLKAADFVNLIEGNELTRRRSAHMQSCARCTEAFVSAQSLHAKLAASAVDDAEIPEPDWFQFRSDVRNSMLSRAAQRQAKGSSPSGWAGWLTQPAMSWGLVVAFAAGLSAGLLLWNRPVSVSPQNQSEHSQALQNSLDNSDLDQFASLDTFDNVTPNSTVGNMGLTSLDPSSIFDEASQLNDTQVDKLQRLLEAGNGASRQ
jgi:hypothetical protein